MRERGAFERLTVFSLHDVFLRGALHQFARELAFVSDVAIHLSALDAIERRLRDVDVSFLDQFAHVAEEECEKKRANVAAVHVRVGHENYFVVAQLCGVEIILAYAGAERSDDGANFFVAEHLVVPRLFDVQDFALEGQDRLIAAVAPALGRAAGGLAFDEEDFAAGGIALLAIGELAGQAARIERGFAASKFTSLAGGFARARGINAFADDFPRNRRVLVEVFAEALVDELLDRALDVAIELALGLPFKLRLGKFHGNHGNEALAHVVARDRNLVFLILQHSKRAGVVIDGARQRRAEARDVRAAIDGVDGVGKGEDVFGVTVVVLQRDFDVGGIALALEVDGRIVERLLAAIEVLYEFGDAAGEAEFGFFVIALVIERDLQPLIEKREFAQPL